MSGVHLLPEDAAKVSAALTDMMAALKFQAALAEQAGGWMYLNDGTHEGQTAPSNADAYALAGAARQLLK